MFFLINIKFCLLILKELMTMKKQQILLRLWFNVIAQITDIEIATKIRSNFSKVSL